MTDPTGTSLVGGPDADRSPALVAVLLAGFAVAVVLRCAIGGADVARSRTAGLVFALVLLLACAGERRWGDANVPGGAAVRQLRVGVLGGVAGGVVLCVPALVSAVGNAPGLTAPARSGFVGWAAVVAVVATAEEVFLRGTLFRLLLRYGVVTAIGVPALAFAALHVPLYGWGAAPLDLAVGIFLGTLRATTGTCTAPAVAHVVADWAAWVLVA